MVVFRRVSWKVTVGCLSLAILGRGPVAAQGTSQLSIDDVSVAEGMDGTTAATLTVRLSRPTIALPPINGRLDYQLGGAYPPPAGVTVLSRDRNDVPAPHLYNICYVNGFQVQPDEEGDWDPDLILRDGNDEPIIDPDWNEMLLDVSTSSKRTRIGAVVGGWITGCALDGFDAVEIDNLDSYSRSGGHISVNDAVAFMVLLSDVAHEQGLAIAQKNAAEILDRRAEMGTDFAVAEECSRYGECGDYVAAYGERVLMIEYRDADFSRGCSQYGATHSIVRRDLYLVTPGSPGYVFAGC